MRTLKHQEHPSLFGSAESLPSPTRTLPLPDQYSATVPRFGASQIQQPQGLGRRSRINNKMEQKPRGVRRGVLRQDNTYWLLIVLLLGLANPITSSS
jgi:hypothetical protein